MLNETLTESLSLINEEKPLPEGWRFERLGDVCFTTSGGTPARGVKEYYGGEISWVKSGELKDTYIESVEETITQLGLKQSSAKKIPADTLLIALYGANVGRLGILKNEAAINQAICAILPNETVFTKFLFYHLMTRRAELINMSFGGAQPNISQEIVKNLRIPLPPTIEEQRRIASILDEHMKAVHQASLAVEEQLAAANLLQNAFLRSIFESEEAKNWERKKISQWVMSGFIEDIQDGNHGEIHPRASEYKKNGIPFVMANCIKGNKLDLSSCNYISEERAASLRIGFSKKGDVLLTHKGSIGFTAVVPEDLDLIVLTPQVTYYRPNPENLDASFLNLAFLQPEFQKQLISIAKQATRDYVGITAQKDLELSIPSLGEQNKIAGKLNEQLQAVATLKKSLNDKLAAVKNLPAALLRKAFAGEI